MRMTKFQEYARNRDDYAECVVLAGHLLSSGYTVEQINERLSEVLEGNFWRDVKNVSKAGVAGLGNFGYQVLRGGANMVGGAGRAAVGVGQALAGTGVGAASGRWDMAKDGLKNIYKGGIQAGGGVFQTLGSPVTGVIRGAEAGRQDGLGMPSGGKVRQFFGLRRDGGEDVQTNKSPEQPPPATPQKRSLPPGQPPQPAAPQKRALPSYKDDPLGFLNDIPNHSGIALFGKDPTGRQKRMDKLFDMVKSLQLKHPDEATAAITHMAMAMNGLKNR